MMTAMTAMVETAAMTATVMAMVTAMVTMPPPLPMEMMLMTTTAAFQGWQ
jgi:hypothetical protein